MEREEVINNAFYDDLGSRWYDADDHPIALLRAENRARSPWVSRVIGGHFSHPCHILDIGCGAGFLSNDLAKNGHKVTGIDLSEKSLQVARERDSTHSASYDHGDATRLPYPDGHFEAVCAMDLLEHVDNPSQVIAEASRVLKPDGLFFFHTFNRTWLSWLFAVKGIEWFIPNAPRKIHLYRHFIKPEELSTYLNKNALALSEIHGLMPKLDREFLKLFVRRTVSPKFSFKQIPSLSCGYVGFALKAS